MSYSRTILVTQTQKNVKKNTERVKCPKHEKFDCIDVPSSVHTTTLCAHKAKCKLNSNLSYLGRITQNIYSSITL